MTYLILGMHKSGTTLLAQTLHASGVDMGPDVDDDRFRYAGNQCESPSVNAINNDILDTHGKNSLDIVPPLEANETPSITQRIGQLIDEQEAQKGHWGLKDPRLCFSYPVWRKYLPDHTVIGVYRDLYGVLGHYLKNKRGTSERRRKIVKAWLAYNEAVLKILEEKGKENGFLFQYEALMEDDRHWERLNEVVGITLTDFRERGMRRSHLGYFQKLGLLKREEKKAYRSMMARLNQRRFVG